MSNMAQDGGGVGVELGAHVDGDPFPSLSLSANVTALHSWLIIVAALVLLWLFGGVFFKSIRM